MCERAGAEPVEQALADALYFVQNDGQLSLDSLL